MERLRRKCDKVGVAIDNGRMVLKITDNAKKYALFTNADHEAYDNLPSHNLEEVIKFWVKKYKAHNIYQKTQAVSNQYESAAYAGPPPNVTTAAINSDATYISALEESVTRQTAECEMTLAPTAKTTQSPGDALMASTLDDFCT